MPRAGVLLILFLSVAACDQPSPAVDTVTLAGEITYPQRITLPEDASARVMLVETPAGGSEPRTLASQQMTAIGQVPVAFELSVARGAIRARDHDYGLWAEITGPNGEVRWRSRELTSVAPLAPDEPVRLRVHQVDESNNQSQTPEQHLSYACNGLRGTIEPVEDGVIATLAGTEHRLRRVRSASGVKYADDDGTVFWRKGQVDALFTYRDQSYRDCIAVTSLTGIGPHIQARGNEPFWNARVLGEGGAGGIQFAVGLDDPTVIRTANATSESVADDTTVYRGNTEGRSVAVRVVEQDCTDSMSGRGFPLTVRVKADGREVRGCGSRVGP